MNHNGFQKWVYNTVQRISPQIQEFKKMSRLSRQHAVDGDYGRFETWSTYKHQSNGGFPKRVGATTVSATN